MWCYLREKERSFASNLSSRSSSVKRFFFVQAEDGIRDLQGDWSSDVCSSDLGALAGMLWGWSAEGVKENEVRRAGLDPSDPRLNQVMKLTEELIDFPRHLSQHPGGFLIRSEERRVGKECRSRWSPYH